MESTSIETSAEMNEIFPSVDRATAKDTDALVRVLSRAFDEDPVHNYIVRQDAKRALAFELWFRVAFQSLALPHGEAWIAENAAGAALWIPPGKWSDWALLQSAHHLVRAVGLRRMPRMYP